MSKRTLKESGYYPAGAEFDPRAPWNEPEPQIWNVQVELTLSFSFKSTIESVEPPLNWFEAQELWKEQHPIKGLNLDAGKGTIEDLYVELTDGRINKTDEI